MIAYLAQGEPQSLREGMGNLIFLGVFFVIAIVAAIWWLRRGSL
jgi:hypothetical protein